LALPAGETELVDAVLAEADREPGTRFRATLPVGDAELVTRLRERCPDVQLRAAGATVLADGILAGH
jgi:hypothetical protein